MTPATRQLLGGSIGSSPCCSHGPSAQPISGSPLLDLVELDKIGMIVVEADEVAAARREIGINYRCRAPEVTITPVGGLHHLLVVRLDHLDGCSGACRGLVELVALGLIDEDEGADAHEDDESDEQGIFHQGGAALGMDGGADGTGGGHGDHLSVDNGDIIPLTS